MKNILIVIDMQKDFIDGSLGTKEAEKMVPTLIKKVKEYDGTVIYTRDTHEKDYLKTPEGLKLPVEHCITGTSGWEIPDKILEAANKKEMIKGLKKIYDKPTFGSTELAEDLRRYYAEHPDQDLNIELIGLCTDICVVSNALLLKAYMPAVNIQVDKTCCAGVTPETHEAALKVMSMCQINVV